MTRPLTILSLLWLVLSRILPRAAPLALSGLVLGAWGGGLLHLVDQPRAWQQANVADDRLGVRLDAVIWHPTQRARVVLGRADLLQNSGPTSADDRHIELRDDDGTLTITNISRLRRLRLGYSDDVAFNADHWRVHDNDQVVIDADTPAEQRIIFHQVKRGDVVQPDRIGIEMVRGSGTSATAIIAWSPYGAHFDSVSSAGGFAHPAPGCHDQTAGGVFAWLEALRAWLFIVSESVVARFGGKQSCALPTALQVRIAGLSFDSFELRWLPHRGFMLVAGARDDLQVRRNGVTYWLANIRHPLQDTDIDGRPLRLTSFVAGRTTYAVTIGQPDPDTVVIRPQANGHVIFGRRCAQQEAGDAGRLVRCADVGAREIVAAWTTTEALGLRQLLAVAGAFFSALLVLWLIRVLLTGRGGAVWSAHASELQFLRPGGALCALCVAIAAAAVVLSIGPWRLHMPNYVIPLPPWPALTAWAMAAVAVACAPGGGLVDGLTFAAVSILVAIGHYSLAAMGFSTGNLAVMRFYEESIPGIAIGGMIVAVSCLPPPRTIGALAGTLLAKPPGRVLPTGIVILGSLIAATLLVWLVLGTETGVGGIIQPSEAIKTMTVVMLAAAFTLALQKDIHYHGQAGAGAMWAAIGIIGSLLVVILVVPIVRKDNAPFLILLVTVVVGLCVVSLLHWGAIYGVRLSYWGHFGRPPDPRPRDSGPPPTTPSRIGWFVVLLLRRICRAVHDRPFELTAVLLSLVLAGSLYGLYSALLTDPLGLRADFEQGIGTRFRIPAERLSSWVEMNSQDRSGRVAIDYPDIDQQVIRSRAMIDSSPCLLPVAPDAMRSAADGSVLAGPVRLAASLVEAIATGADCPHHPAEGGNRLGQIPLNVESYRLPEVQNDFIATWIILVFGRDTAVLIACVEIATVALMLLAAFQVARFAPGDEPNRGPATVLAYTTVGFAIMLGLQWLISWMNAFGLLPVMGQPATYLSAGRSHLLMFGIPVLTTALACSRLSQVLRHGRQRDALWVPWRFTFRWKALTKR